jgi:hypothetical protein
MTIDITYQGEFIKVFDHLIYKISSPSLIDYQKAIKQYLKDSNLLQTYTVSTEFTNKNVDDQSIPVHDHGISCVLIHYLEFDNKIHRPTFIKKNKTEKEYHVMAVKQNDIVIFPPGVLHGVAPSNSNVPRVTKAVLFDILS